MEFGILQHHFPTVCGTGLSSGGGGSDGDVVARGRRRRLVPKFTKYDLVAIEEKHRRGERLSVSELTLLNAVKVGGRTPLTWTIGMKEGVET